MESADYLSIEASRSLRRLAPRVRRLFFKPKGKRPEAWQEFSARLEQHFPRLFGLLVGLYGTQYDFFFYLEELLLSLAEAWLERPEDLKALDREREATPRWFEDNGMLGGVCYVDLFAGDLQGIRRQIPYFKELGLTYLHLMPLFRTPVGENDGGYAVSSYREVNPALGNMQELISLAGELRKEGISLTLDLVFNHTSNEHDWARQARAGDDDRLAYYRTFPDRELPDRYEKTLREIFPDEHPGAFIFDKEMGCWVWSTFHAYQWDLNYANPAVFNQMAREMLFLANVGVEVLRLDAVAFIWKEMGTNCENLPQAHQIIQAFNAVARIAAPGLLFKSEAIVHPDEVARYISPHECQLSYNPLLMALLWNTLATRDVRMLRQAMGERYKAPDGCAWVNYVRCHDDIGWTFSDEDADRLGVNGFDHRRFLNEFYTGRFPGSFARGLTFQENPKTGDARICGTCASLAGLEKALHEETGLEVELAIRRILLAHGIIMTSGGIPLIYLGDEWGTLNDYSFRSDPAKAHDNRWVHRPFTDWERAKQRSDPATIEGKVFLGLKKLIAMRKNHAVFGGGALEVIETGNSRVLGYLRHQAGDRVLILANFSEEEQVIPQNLLRMYGLGYEFFDLLNERRAKEGDLLLKACEMVCLQTVSNQAVTNKLTSKTG